MKMLLQAFVAKTVESENAFIFSGTRAIYSKRKRRSFSVNFKYKKYCEEWEKKLDDSNFGILAPADRPQTKRLLKVTNYRSGRKFDHSNLVGGAKPIPDYLKRHNWIFDDSPAWFKDDYVQEKPDGRGEGSLIELYEIPKGYNEFHITAEYSTEDESYSFIFRWVEKFDTLEELKAFLESQGGKSLILHIDHQWKIDLKTPDCREKWS